MEEQINQADNQKIDMAKAFIMCHADQNFNKEHTENKVTHDGLTCK
jgi:hypothetical protein